MTRDRRPDPEALLARAREEEARRARGRLKIFFGAAAGVGKTYAMLEAARDKRADGVDVVIGYVETHGRAETDALLEGLEVLPPRLVPYRSATLRELDLDAALARRPAIIVVDELAHTNAPGSRHAKRWQDVVELLDTGIDVYTTMNVQHVESLNDVVARITGVVVRETVPDSLLEQAEEIELIDLPPDDLLQRLRDGKVYVPGQAEEALRNFFRKGNLIALRELALRRTAERVDAQMRLYMRDHAIGAVWPTAERLLVAVGPGPFSARLVRAAKRMAERLQADWHAVYVETPAQLRLSPEARDSATQTLRLAESLGARTATVSGQRMSDEILAFARERNVTRIIVGKPTRSLWKRIVLGSIVDALVQGSGDIDVYVITGDKEGPAVSAPPPRARVVDWTGYGVALAAVVLATAAAWLMFPFFELSNLIMVYLVGTVLVAARRGRGPAMLAAVVSIAAFDFFFVPPYLTFAVSDTQYVITFAVMLMVAIVISNLTIRIRGQAEGARDREQRTAALYAMSREMASTRGTEQLVSIAVRHVVEVFRVPVVVLLPDASGVLQPVDTDHGYALDTNEVAVARWVLEHRQPAGRSTGTLPGAAGLYLPLLAPRGCVGVLGVRPDDTHGFDAPERMHQLETFVNQTALALERARLADEAQAAHVRMESERLRSSLLSSVSHDLRTPLTTITGVATTLLQQGDQLDAATRRDLLESVRDEADLLNRLVHNLLEMTRLEAGALELGKEWHSLEEVIGAAVSRLGKRLAGRRVTTRVPPDLPLVAMDDVLVQQVLVNLLDNALKYTPPGAPIDIVATATDTTATVEVTDRGPGLPPGDEERIFEKFYRGRDGHGRGVGLGLAICQGIVRAHGGRIWAQNVPGGGVSFLFTLPVTPPPPLAVPPDE